MIAFSFLSGCRELVCETRRKSASQYLVVRGGVVEGFWAEKIQG